MAKKDNIAISFGVDGMNRQSFNHQDDEKTFIFQNNGNMETDEESMTLTNEHSNLLCSRFKPGYVVIGSKYDSLNSKVWYFLTEKDEDAQGKRKSEIGFIKFNNVVTNIDDVEIDCGCDIVSVLGKPLEDQIPFEYCEYQTLIGDDCNNCLNFSPNKPIRGIVLKQETCGYTMTFTDDNNPPRYIVLNKIEEYKFTGSKNCGIDETVPTCLDCDKLRVFPLYTIPCLTPKVIQFGGRLKRGMYEFLVAYCDKLGNEMSPYFSITAPISIFDKNNNVLDQTQQADVTNLGIRLEVEGLDKRFNYYKVAVIQNADIQGIIEPLFEGIHNITDKTIVYTSDIDKKGTTLNHLFAEKPNYKTWGGLISANNYLIGYDYTLEKEWNLQPAMNLMGSLLKWQTVEAKEDLYADGVNDSMYSSYMRDEVYPFGIRFSTNTGYRTSVFPLVSRPGNDEEWEDMRSSSSKDIKSINDNAPDCSETSRKYRWQYYNTASVDSGVQCVDSSLVDGVEVEREMEEQCFMKNIKTTEAGVLDISLEDDFTSLKRWVQEHGDAICTPANPSINPYYNAELCENLKDPKPNEICPTDWTTNNIFPFPICTTDCGVGTCATPILKSKEVSIGAITNEVQTFIPKALSDYKHSRPPKTCQDFEAGWNNIVPLNTQIPLHNAFARNSAMIENRSCDEYADFPATSQSFDGKVTWHANLGSLLGTIPSIPTTDFHNVLHLSTRWYKYEFTDEEMIFEITKNSSCKSVDAMVGDGRLRYTIYKDCPEDGVSYEILESGVINVNDGYFRKFERADYDRNYFYIVFDSPIIFQPFQIKESTDYADYYTEKPPCGCVDMLLRPLENSKVKIEYDSIRLDKTVTYSTKCKFLAPESNICKPVGHKVGTFAFWESEVEYPDNSDLYDSSGLKISDSDLTVIGASNLNRFKEYYVDSEQGGEYVWKTENSRPITNFTCRPIRHYKFPDNRVIPFMDETPLSEFSDSRIYPIGVTIDTDVINAFLNISEKNNLITKEQRDSITGFEIFRGDRAIHKSIIMKGIVNDMYVDPRETNSSQLTLFRNFPYNTLGANAFLTSDKTRTNLLDHPFDSEGNNRFSLIAPEVYYNRPTPPTEVSIEGYMYGNSIGGFKPLEDHSEWVILGEKAYKLANTLATLEVVFEGVMNTALATIEATKNSYVGGGLPPMFNVAQVAGYFAAGLVAAANTASALLFKQGKYETQWLQSFEDLGNTHNFAEMFVSQKGWYNSFVPNNEEDNMLRGAVACKYLKPGVPMFTEGKGKPIRINNRQREDSLYISFGDKYNIEYPNKYRTWDNYSLAPLNSSRYISSDVGCNNDTNNLRRIASPYFSMKNYVADQYGEIDGVKWLSINHCGNLDKENTCKSIFGGDTKISRVDFKNKVPFFNRTAIDVANKVPFNYNRYPNIATPRFYASYKSEDKTKGGFKNIPYIFTEFNLDCRKENTNVFYEAPPSKMYTHTYAVPYFLVESDINANYRYAGKEPHEQFASNGLSVEDWVQEKKVSIAFNNIFYYNQIYSNSQTGLPYRTLTSLYDKKTWDCLANSPNGVVYSQQDNSEVSLNDPWLVFKPFDIYQFRTDYGKLISMRNIESEQVLALFEDNAVIFNAVDTLRDRLTPENEELGMGGMFASRPAQFSFTELGETGGQHDSMTSCEFGHFWVDAKRGKVFQLQPNAKGLTAISDFKQKGEESGMRKWFKKHLPFKILRQNVANFNELDTDNSYKGLGILTWWDSKFKRLFITKRDYITVGKCKNYIEYHNGDFYLNQTKCSNANSELTCPDGYTYNSVTQMCDKVTAVSMCDEGYTYNRSTNQCEKTESVDAISTDTTTITLNCPQGYTLQDSQCVKVETTPKTCPIGTTDNGSNCITTSNRPMDIIFVKDKSGSVNSTESSQLSAFMSSIVDGLSSKLSTGDVRIGNVIFATGYEITSQLSSDINVVKSGISSGSSTSGSTNIAGGVCLAKSMLTDNSRRKLIIIFIDGIQNVPAECFADSNLPLDVQLTTGIRKMENLEGIKTGMIYIGDQAQGIENLYLNQAVYLPSLGSGVKGKFAYRADTFDSLPSVVENVLVEVNKPDITIVPKECPTGYLPTGTQCSRILTVTATETTETTTTISCPEGYSYNSVTKKCEKVLIDAPCKACQIVGIRCQCTDSVQPILKDSLLKIELTDTRYFKDVSWTLAYSPIYGNWISYYDYHPDYAIAFNDYFQTGINYASQKNAKRLGVWSHLLTNKSFQVFYGDYYPWTIELPVKNTYSNKVLQDLKIWTVSQRYHNESDYAVWRKKSFNKLNISNQTNNSGLLHLNYEDNMSKSKYPLYINATEQGIPATHFDDTLNINYFYNRVRKEDYHVPIWNWDENEIQKTLSSKAMSFNSKKILERMRGDWFVVQLTQDSTSQFKQYFKWMINKESPYQ